MVFLFISTTVSVTSGSIYRYLEKTKLGGLIPISIKVDNEFEDVYLILMTKEKTYILDSNKTIVTQFQLWKKTIKLWFCWPPVDFEMTTQIYVQNSSKSN